MSAFQSLALALKVHYHKPFAQLPPDIQQRILEDFAPWNWEGKTPRARCQRAKQWDYENDPARREVREGIEALTNPDSPAYSDEETRRLRGDYLPVPDIVKPIVDLPPLKWDQSQPVVSKRNSPVVKESAQARRDRLLKTFDEEVKASGKHGALASVAAREKLVNPKADRSNIGKQITQARAEQIKARQATAVIGSMIRDGKRST